MILFMFLLMSEYVLDSVKKLLMWLVVIVVVLVCGLRL